MAAVTILAAALLFAYLIGTGCSRKGRSEDRVTVAPGVVFVRDRAAGVQVLDIDLSEAPVRPAVVAGNVERIRNNFVGEAKTVRAWSEATGAPGGINAGFFGETYDSGGQVNPLGQRKQIVGLAMADGKVVAPGGFVQSTRYPGERFLRAAVGFGPSGTPDISWATGTRRAGVKRYLDPVNPGPGAPWRVQSAVACGPRLFVRGARRITVKEERLASPGALSRAFVAYDLVGDRPRHLVLGRADGMEFAQVADYLESYFRRAHGTGPHDGMCLDGGPSAQLVYRDGDALRDAEETGVLVPTAILLLPK